MDKMTYTARRQEPVTARELEQIDDIVCGYALDSALENDGSGFVISGEGERPAGAVFSGYVRLAGNSLDEKTDAFLFWADCLGDLRRVLDRADWEVLLDGVPLAWDEDCGWIPDV